MRNRSVFCALQEDVDVKDDEEAKLAKKAEAEAAFQAWLDRKRAAQKKEKLALLGRQVGVV